MPLIDRFRDVLASLPASGQSGFEGLVAEACTQVSGATFRLVKSGRQFGRDAEVVVEGAAILFEAKRYTSRLSYADLAIKLVEASDRSGRPIEAWGAAATVAFDAADAEDLRTAGEKRGVTVLLLDWTPPSPRLAILLAGAREAVLDWFARHAPGEAAGTAEALEEVQRHPLYEAGLRGIRADLSPGTLGLAMARRRNAEWLATRFSDRRAALHEFNQPLAPLDAGMRPRPVERSALERSVRDAVDTWPGTAQAVVLTGPAGDGAAPGLEGDEGVGKSWAVVRSWLTMADDATDPRPLLLFMAPHMWRDGDEQRPLELLARLCMLQCGSGIETRDELERWSVRLTRWRGRPAVAGCRPAVVVVLDGVNERAHRWAALITGLVEMARSWPMRVVVTSRKGAYERDLAPQLRAIDVVIVPVGAFSDADLDAALSREGRDPTAVRDPLRTFLRNPRVLSVGIPLLGRLDPDEVGVERLLFEYLVKRQEERAGRSSFTAVQLAQTLVGHARTIRDRLLARRPLAESKLFDHADAHGRLAVAWVELVDDLGDIVDSHFLRVVDAKRNRYAFTTQALPLGMALLVVDELDRAVAEGRGEDLPGLLEAIVDPIGAIDATSRVLLSALELALADGEVADAVAEELMIAVLTLQNVPAEHRSRIFAGLRERPAIYVAATDRLFGEDRDIGRREWMMAALASRRFDASVQPVLDGAVRRWLRSWQPEPIDPDPVGFPADHAATARTEHERRAQEHRQQLSSMSDLERSFVESELVPLPAGRKLGVDEVAVRLLAGRALLPFAGDLFAWCVAVVVSWGFGAYDQMRWLRRLAPIDWEETTEAVARLAEAVVHADRSTAFGWAYDHALSFGGDPAQGERADALWPRLHDGPRFSVAYAWDGLCDVDPLDCDARTPDGDLREARERYEGWCAQDGASPLLMRHADTVVSRTRQILCRFAPEFAAERHRAFARRAPDVTGAAPAVVADFVAQDTAILEVSERMVLLEWLRRLLADGPLAEPNGEAPARLLAAILPGLGPEAQFDAVTASLSDERHPFWLEGFMLPLPGDVLAARLRDAAGRDPAALRYGLIFAGANPVRPETVRPAIAEALSRAEPSTRGIALRTLIRTGAREDVNAFAAGAWHWSGTLSEAAVSEDFCGSVCLLKARGSRDEPALLGRIHPTLWSRAVLAGGPAVATAVGEAVVAALSGIDASMRPPGIEITCTRSDEGPGVVNELAGIDVTVSYTFGRLVVDPGGLRRRLGMQDYVAYGRASLARGRGPLLYPLSSAAVDRIAAVAPETFARILSLVEEAPSVGEGLSAAAVLAHDVARSLSTTDAPRAARLFSAFDDAMPVIAEVMPYSGLARQTLLLWFAEDAPGIDAVRRRRLDRAASDDVLAAHALAAAIAGKHALMKAYVLDRAESRHPAAMARALTLAGFSPADDAFTALFSQPRFAHGFLGDVTASAREAARKAAWAQRWCASAVAARSELDVWRFSELAAASADARCVLWMERGPGSPCFERTRPAFRGALAHSAASAERDRAGKLFSERAPPEWLSGTPPVAESA